MDNKIKAFTIIELMIVLAFIAVLLAIAIPNYLKTSTASTKTICINNLKQIDAAIEQWAADHSIEPGTVPTAEQESQIYSYVEGRAPKCPSSGKYILNAFASKPQVSCTRGESEGHKLPE